MPLVRKLNEAGIARFTEYVGRIAAGEPLDPPRHLLSDEECSEALLGTAMVDSVTLDSKLVAAKYLQLQLSGLDRSEVDNNVGLWCWLSLFYFDEVCPVDDGGIREPGELVRHVLSHHAHKYYRHLLAGPYRLIALHGDAARVFLHGPLTEHGDFSEQLASRMQIISNRSLIKVVDRLYFDLEADGAGKPKRGATTRTRPGNVRRLVAIMQQFDLTYDMYSMTPDQILSLLPKEFDYWKRRAE